LRAVPPGLRQAAGAGRVAGRGRSGRGVSGRMWPEGAREPPASAAHAPADLAADESCGSRSS